MGIAVLAPNKPFWGARIVQIPFLSALRRRFPDSPVRIHSPVAEAEEFVDWGLAASFGLYRRTGRRPSWTSLWGEIRSASPERVYNLRRWSSRCCTIAALAPGRRVGFARTFLAPLLHETAPYDSSIYLSARYLSLAEEEVRDGRDDRSVPLFREWMEERAVGRTAAPGVLLMAGAARPEKRWPLERFLELAGRLGGELPVAILIGPDEAGERERLAPRIVARDGVAVLPAGAAGNEVDVEVLDAPALPELLARIRAAELVVANDCGPSHLAQLAGVRFLGLYRKGATTTADWFADRENADLVVAGTDGWEPVGVDEVAARARALLSRPARAEEIVRFSRGG